MRNKVLIYTIALCFLVIGFPLNADGLKVENGEKNVTVETVKANEKKLDTDVSAREIISRSLDIEHGRIDPSKEKSNADGIHVATRMTSSKKYKEIHTIFDLGSNIGTTNDTAVYFMHYFGASKGVDAGIYYQNGSFYMFSYGKELLHSDNWNSAILNGVYAGDKIEVNTRVVNNKLRVTVSKNGQVKGILDSNIKSKLRNAILNGTRVGREFNIAGHNGINNKDVYFSWSNAESSMVTKNNTLLAMKSNNTYLKPIYYDKPYYNHSNIGKDRDATTQGNFIYDEAWCRCNFY